MDEMSPHKWNWLFWMTLIVMWMDDVIFGKKISTHVIGDIDKHLMMDGIVMDEINNTNEIMWPHELHAWSLTTYINVQWKWTQW